MLLYILKVQQMKQIKIIILVIICGLLLVHKTSLSINNEVITSNITNIIGYIKVNNTNINYPIVQSSNNQYYLNHDYNGNHNSSGAIFLDYRSNPDLTSKNTILYGHARISDQTMFGSLYNILNKTWYENQSNYLITYTKNNINYYYEIFSTYIIPKETYYLKVNFNNSPSYINFLRTLKSRSYFNYPADLDENDLILTLTTCYKNNQSLVLQAKLIYNNNVGE